MTQQYITFGPTSGPGEIRDSLQECSDDLKAHIKSCRDGGDFSDRVIKKVNADGSYSKISFEEFLQYEFIEDRFRFNENDLSDEF